MNTDPEAIRFTAQTVRPLAEAARALVARITDAQNEWYGGMNNKVGNTADIIADGREAEGESRLSGVDITNLMGVLFAMNAAANTEIIRKPCVRPLQVQTS